MSTPMQSTINMMARSLAALLLIGLAISSQGLAAEPAATEPQITVKAIGNSNDYFFRMTLDSSGNLVLSGSREGTSKDALVIKTTKTGEVIWEKTYGGSQRDEFRSIQLKSDDSIAGGGITYSYGSSRGKMYFVRAQADGTFSYEKAFGTNDWTHCHDLDTTDDGGFILVGNSTQTDAWLDIRLTKLNSAGDEEWTRFFAKSQDDSGFSVRQTSDGGYLLCGRAGVWSSSPKLYVIKTDSTGVKQWERLFGGISRTAGSADDGRCVRELSDGSFGVIGELLTTDKGYEIFFCKLNPAGETIWEKTYGSPEREGGRAMVELPDGFAIVGNGESGDSWSGILLMTDKDGNQTSFTRIESAGTDSWEDIVSLGNDTLAILGNSRDTENVNTGHLAFVNLDDPTGVTITVNNVAPTVTGGPEQAADEGAEVTISATFTDPSPVDTHTAKIDWGDGTIDDLGAVTSPISAMHTYTDNKDYTVKVLVTDDDGGLGKGTVKCAIANVAPVVDAGADLQGTEGSPITVNATFTDVSTSDTHKATIDWGDGNKQTINNVTSPLSVEHTYVDDGSYAVVVTITDDDGGTHSDWLVVIIDNVEPTIEVQKDKTVNEGDTVGIRVIITDPGTSDTHQLTINWGDGNTETVDATSRNATYNHVYVDNGVYSVKVDIAEK